jgi:hypothetical protein
MANDEAAVSMRVMIAGNAYDLSNISGKAKQRLIQEGKIPAANFIGGDNLPGKVIAEMRAKEKVNTDKLEKELQKKAEEELIKQENVYKVGDTVVFRKYASQILEVHPKKGLKLKLREGRKSKWIHHSKVQPVSDDEE